MSISFISFLEGRIQLTPLTIPGPNRWRKPGAGFCRREGTTVARRAVELAVAGGHNLLLIGSPGAGKSMLAKRIPGILPPMTFEESIETSRIYSVAACSAANSRCYHPALPGAPPFHFCGGIGPAGQRPSAGEISLAHNGVLFLDELPEFNRQAIEVLRQPMEDGTVTISRVRGTLTYPCRVMVVAAMNPCPCGYFGHPTGPAPAGKGR